ncbi:MAG TPA: translation elongation factor 4 [Clostridia bacterium]|jgi:GTP-binding protein LepA|nr:elongation factor 4 [Clostridiaceae bacterium]HOA30819.1 translation elongation factor 4 [Clostridia bacterium]HPZ51503.1 translation elongation factor 4 [Clostridia bacterium]
MNNQDKIRNFCIIAHIDHGKSTLADRILEQTGELSEREMEEQVLDNMDLERERGITIKARSVRLNYLADDGVEYIYNLIDTPGHVDFTYEVSRTLAACEGAILVVDAAQGIEAQTLANVYMAMDHNLEIIPVINKIDLPAAQPEVVKKEIEEVIGIPASDAPLISAKAGIGIKDVLEEIATRIPSPSGDKEAPLQALIFDSVYDTYRGVIIYVKVVNGRLKKGDTIKLMSTEKTFIITELGWFKPGTFYPCDSLETGEVGYIVANIKNIQDANVGDTVTLVSNPAKNPLPGYKKAKPMVFCGVYPVDGSDFEGLRDALAKLQLNDASLAFEPETSKALGFGFRCGFLGLLHMEIILERIQREFDIDIITTTPSVIYRIYKTNGEVLELDNPTNMPSVNMIDHIEEPMVKASILTPAEFVGNIMELTIDRRGTFLNMDYLERDRVLLTYEIPLNEVIYDYFDALKSRTKGYASLDYEMTGYKVSKLVRLDIYVNGEVVDALSFIVHEEKAYQRGRKVAEKLKEAIPRHQFEVPIQAYLGGKIIARETVKAYRKDVTSKCYGGDISRKKKLLEKQKEGKKRMRQFGSVEIPQEAFLTVLKLDD